MQRDHKEPDEKLILKEILQKQFLTVDAGKVSLYDLLTDAKASPIKESLYGFLNSKHEKETIAFFETLETAVTTDGHLKSENLKAMINKFFLQNAPDELNISSNDRATILDAQAKNTLSIKTFENAIGVITGALSVNLRSAAGLKTLELRDKTTALINTIYHDASLTKKPISPRAMGADTKTPAPPSASLTSLPKNPAEKPNAELKYLENMLKETKLTYPSTLDDSIVLLNMQKLFTTAKPSEFGPIFRECQNLIISIREASPANQKNALEAFVHTPDQTLKTFIDLQSKKSNDKLLYSAYKPDTSKALLKLGIKGENPIIAIKKIKMNTLCSALGQNALKQARASEIFSLLNKIANFLGEYEPKAKKPNIDKLTAMAFVSEQLEKMSTDNHITDPEKLKTQLIETLNAARQIAGKIQHDTFFGAIGKALNETMISNGDIINDANKIKPIDAAGNNVEWKAEGQRLKAAFNTGSAVVADPKQDERLKTLTSAQKSSAVAAPTPPAPPKNQLATKLSK
jgi:hypothetical protein